MPYVTSFFQLPCGARCSRVNTSGTFSREDGVTLIHDWEPGGPLHGLPALVQTRELASVSAEARGFFAGRGSFLEEDPWVAVVVTNPVIRVTTNFILRIQKSKTVRLFSGEPEAIQWLDERIRKERAAKAS